MESIPKSIFYEAYTETLGMEKAQSLLDESLRTLGLNATNGYSVADTKRIIKHLKDMGGLIKIVAATIATRLILSGKYDQQ